MLDKHKPIVCVCARSHLHLQHDSSSWWQFVLWGSQGAALPPLLVKSGISCPWFTWSSTRLVHLHSQTDTFHHKCTINCKTFQTGNHPALQLCNTLVIWTAKEDPLDVSIVKCLTCSLFTVKKNKKCNWNIYFPTVLDSTFKLRLKIKRLRKENRKLKPIITTEATCWGKSQRSYIIILLLHNFAHLLTIFDLGINFN